MRARIEKLEADRLKRRAAQGHVKSARAAVLADHPGMDPNDVAFLLMVSRWREEQLSSRVQSGRDSGEDEVYPSMPGGEGGAIRCCVRKRPLLPREEAARVLDVVSCAAHGAHKDQVVLHEPREKVGFI
jgi:hypothetical protein